jgi:hypothetical protein
MEQNPNTRGVIITINEKGIPGFQMIGEVSEVEVLGICKYMQDLVAINGLNKLTGGQQNSFEAIARLSEGQNVIVKCIEDFIQSICKEVTSNPVGGCCNEICDEQDPEIEYTDLSKDCP